MFRRPPCELVLRALVRAPRRGPGAPASRARASRSPAQSPRPPPPEHPRASPRPITLGPARRTGARRAPTPSAGSTSTSAARAKSSGVSSRRARTPTPSSPPLVAGVAAPHPAHERLRHARRAAPRAPRRRSAARMMSRDHVQERARAARPPRVTASSVPHGKGRTASSESASVRLRRHGFVCASVQWRSLVMLTAVRGMPSAATALANLVQRQRGVERGLEERDLARVRRDVARVVRRGRAAVLGDERAHLRARVPGRARSRRKIVPPLAVSRHISRTRSPGSGM